MQILKLEWSTMQSDLIFNLISSTPVLEWGNVCSELFIRHKWVCDVNGRDSSALANGLNS